MSVEEKIKEQKSNKNKQPTLFDFGIKSTKLSASKNAQKKKER